jgi:hypothetical protein
VPLAVVLCGQAWQDPSTGKWFILGTFTRLSARSFPATVPSIVVYTALTGGQGEVALRLVLRDADGKALGEAALPVWARELHHKRDSRSRIHPDTTTQESFRGRTQPLAPRSREP